MNAARSGFLPYLLLLATILVVVEFFQTRAIDVEQHNRRLELLLQLKQVEGELDRDVLRVTSFLLHQYDPLVGGVRRLHELSDRARADDLALDSAEGQAYRDGLDRYLDAQGSKLVLLERIKSETALVRNGLHYLPEVAQKLRALDAALGAQVSAILNELLRYNLLTAESDAAHIEAHLDEVEAFAQFDSATGALLRNTLFHMRANLRLVSELASLRDEYVAVPSGARFDALYTTYSALYAKMSRRAEVFSVLLLILSVGLFVGLGFALRHLFVARRRAENAWNQLHDAVESLGEAFALFDRKGRLVLHNRRYLDFYPWLAGQLSRHVTAEDIRCMNDAAGAFVQPGDKWAAVSVPCDEPRSYLEQLSDGRWYLASDACTSAGETVCVRVDISEDKRREQELRKLYRALEQSPATVVITDTRGNIEYVNPKFEETTGYRAEEVMGQNPRLLKSGDKSPGDYKELWDVITAGKVWRGQFHNRRKDGAIYWEAASISPVRDAGGEITHFIAVKEDITARKRAEDQLRMNATVFETTTEGIMITDADTRIKTVNPAFSRITGYEPEEVIGKKASVLSSGRHDAEFYKTMWQSLQTHGYWSGEIWNRRKDGSVYPEWLSLAAIDHEGEPVKEYVAVFSDITRRKADEEQIRRQANYDALTGLPNRSLLMDRLSRSIAGARREGWTVALLFIDLDRFKGVNDTLGHVAGDELLQQVAERLQCCVRETDTVARFGGDEFVVVLEDVKDPNDAAEVAKKAIAKLDVVFSLLGREVFIGASIGITLFPDDSQDAVSMLRNADMAMYRAKDAGRNNYQFFTLSMNEQVHQRMALEGELRVALERDELFLVYQPLVRFADGGIVGVEALLRWRHPQRGLVSPEIFIPLAEDTGLIGPIGLWVMRKACEQAGQWWRQGLELRLGVNLSSRQFALDLTAPVVAGILAEAGFPPTHLTLEITESLILEGRPESLEWLQSFKALGASLAVDDFGTGYSSLSYLKRFPMDVLKIDRSFVDGVPGEREDASLVRAIVAMADSLGLGIVAEGIETEEQRRFLEELGCEIGQGFLFGRPQPAEQLTAALLENAASVATAQSLD